MTNIDKRARFGAEVKIIFGLCGIDTSFRFGLAVWQYVCVSVVDDYVYEIFIITCKQEFLFRLRCNLA